MPEFGWRRKNRCTNYWHKALGCFGFFFTLYFKPEDFHSDVSLEYKSALAGFNYWQIASDKIIKFQIC